MKMMHRNNIFYGSLLLISMSGMTSCIDEDLSDCPPFEKEVDVTYQLEVAQDVDLGFSNDVNSLHLGFWNTPSSLYRERTFSKSEFPENLIFHVTLPVDNYSHVAMANCEQQDGSHMPFPKNLADVAFYRTLISQDTIAADAQPAYTGNLVMDMGMNYDNETYRVMLSPVSAKYVIHVNHPSTLKDVRCFIQGTKSGYTGWEQTWLANEKLVTDASRFAQRGGDDMTTGFSFYAFPTLDEVAVRAADAEMQEGWWKLYFYSRLDDKIVQHIFTVKQPVAAGQVFEGTFNVTEQGGESVDVETGVEFDPDWNPGNDFDIEM